MAVMKSKPKGSPAGDRLELLKVVLGGSVVALLAVAYLLHAGRGQGDLLGVIGVGVGCLLRGRGGRAG